MKLLIFTIFSFFSLINYAETFYWIGNSGDWNDESHWSLNSGGNPSGNVPIHNDDVVFDDKSFKSNNSKIVFDKVNVRSLTFSSKYSSKFYGQSITVTNDLIINTKVVLNTTCIFENFSDRLNSVNTNGGVQNSNFIFKTGNWELKSNLLSSYVNDVNVTCNYFDANSFSISAENFIAINSKLNLSNSNIFTTNNISFVNIKKEGNDPVLHTNGTSKINKGKYKNATTKDQTFNCPTGGLVLDVTITSDYNGSDISCNGECDGELTIVASGSPGPFSYEIDGGGFSALTIFSNLCVGNHSITVIDSSQQLAPGVFAQCTIDDNLTEPSILVFSILFLGQPDCPGTCTTPAFTTVAGGTGAVTITWPTSGEMTANPVGLCPGVNPVIVEDLNGCNANEVVFVTDLPPITFDVDITQPVCNGDLNGEILISNEAGGNEAGGPKPWTYNFNPIPPSGASVNPAIGLGAGVYTVTVIDSLGCQKDSIVLIIDPPILSTTAINPQNVSCFGFCDGELTALPVGGVTPYSFEWFDNTTGLTTGFTDSIPTTFCTGDYYVEVTDAFGCVVQSAAVNIGTPTEVLANAIAYDAPCFGVCEGSAAVDASGGTPGYTYQWTTQPLGGGAGALDSIFGLCPGQFQVIVFDANMCPSTPQTVEVFDGIELTLSLNGTDPTCYDLCDGSVTAVAGGGAGGYLYSWSPAPPVGQGTATISGLCANVQYDLTVTDANLCTITDNLTLNLPPVYDITVNQTDLLCFGDVNGTITVTVNDGGSGVGYTYNWLPGNPIGQGTNAVTNLGLGNYSVTIADGIGCDTTLNFTITSPPELIATASVISNTDCFGDCNGSAQVVVTGGTPLVNISWDDPNNQNTLVASNLCVGNYTVTLTDQNLCTANDNITITEPAEFDVSVSQTALNCFGDCDATATVTVNSGGTPIYTISWNDPLNQIGTTATLCAGAYQATLSDQNGCDSIFNFNIVDPAELTISVTIDADACFGTCLGTASFTTTGGTGVLTYDWFVDVTNVSLGINSVNSGPLCPGDYYAVVTDANGCSTTSPVFTINELPEIISSVISTTDASCGLCDATATIDVVGGAGGFTYNWVPAPTIGGQGTVTGSGLCGGVYSIDIVDVAGCTSSQGVAINSVALEVLTLDSVDVTCFGDGDGQANVSFVCLEPPCVIEWFDNITGVSTGQFGNNATLLQAGEYLAVLTNNLGCVISDTIVVNEPPEIIASITNIEDEMCFNQCDGTATVLASGGEGNLFYNWNPNPGAGQGTVNALGLCAGNYDITVTDDSSCFVTIPFTINPAIEITVDNLSATDVSCFGINDGTVTVLASGGNGILTYEWFLCGTNNSVGNGANLGALPPGDYYAVVTDGDNCTVNSNCITVNPKVDLTGIINSQNSSCFGDCDGEIDVVANGGDGNYFYQWLDGTQTAIGGQTNDTISNICQGTYYLTIVDGANCTTTLGPIDMTQPISPWNVTLSSTDVDCNGGNTGSAGVIVNAGNVPPYSYLWDDILVQTTATANNLIAGNYTVIISDAGVCDTTIQFVINEAPAFNVGGSQTNIDCQGDLTGTATVNPMGGNAPYVVTWSDGQIGVTATGLGAGLISANITDNNGCSLDTTFNILEPLNPLVVASMFNNNATCSVCNGSATINITGGTGAYTFDWLGNPTGDGTNSVLNLCAGIITVDVTDANGCTLNESIPISDIDGEDVNVNVLDVTCFGLNDGEADAIFVCSDPVCVQEWFDVSTGLTTGVTTTHLGPVAAGDYFVQVTNASGCVTIENVTINSPTQILANEVITDITCAGDSDASITLTPTGGSNAGYSYAWSPIPSNGDGTNLASPIGPGLWTVTITDGTGCSEGVDFNILDTIPILIVPTPTDVVCANGNDGSITTVVSGGYGGYTYQWFMNGVIMPGETGVNINGLAPGNYNIEVTDMNGCIQTLINDVTISEPFPITAPITSTDILCNGNDDGTATLNVSGGILPYIINWYDSNNLLIGQTGPTAISLGQGDYYAIVTDFNGCSTTSALVTINEPTVLTFTITSTDESCFSQCDGTASVVLAGGSLPYTYEWLDVLGNPIPNGTLPAVNFLCVGNYTIEGTDANGCTTIPQNVVISGLTQITANLFSNDSDCGFTNGDASVFANGGNPPYTYQWQDATQVDLPGETNSTLLNIGSGVYYVIVTDVNFCNETFQINVSDIPTTTIVWDLIKHPTCFSGNDGEIQVTVSGPSVPFNFVWNPGGDVSEDINSLIAGNYVLQVTDALGCLSFYDTTLVNPDEIIVTPTIIDSDCDLCNGEISTIVTGGTGVLTLTWNNGASGTNLQGLCPSVYEVTVVDGGGCLITDQITVNNNSGLTTDIVISAITCFESCDGVITVNGVGGTAPYTFNWLNNGSTNNSESNLCADNYIIEVTDAIGCVSPVQVDLLNPMPIEVISILNTPTCGVNNGSISITSSGGSLPHTYSWSTGANTASISNLNAGVYVLTVTEFSGCTKDFTFTLNNENGPEVSLQALDLNCNGDCNGLVSSTITGGTPNYNFQWYDEGANVLAAETNQNLANQCAGIYTIEVTDNAGCIIFETIELTEPDTLLLNSGFTIDPTCNGDCDGSIVVNPIGGVQPYIYLWDDPSNQTVLDPSGLCDGTYNVTITDVNGCVVNQNATLIEPLPIAIVLDSIVDATCVNSADGGVYLTINGGSPPFDIQWSTFDGKDIVNSEDLEDVDPMDYIVTVIDFNGCIAVDTFAIDTLLTVIAFAGNDTVLCFGQGITLIGSSNQSNTDYTWFDINVNEISDTNELILPSQVPGVNTYLLEASYNGCSYIDTIVITTINELIVDAGPDIEVLSFAIEVIGGSPTVPNNTTFYWTPSIYLNDSLLTNPSVIKPQVDTWYMVVATDTNGCSNYDSVFVEVIPVLVIPDGISPNGDGKNETWQLVFKDDFPDMEVSVYNRWGELLFYDNNGYANEWDGKFNGEELPVGSYYYVIDVHHKLYPEPFTGPITIMR